MKGGSRPPLPIPVALTVLRKRAELRDDGSLTPWEEVARKTHHSKTKVLAVWTWFKDLSWDEAKSLLGDNEEILRLRPDYLEGVQRVREIAQLVRQAPTKPHVSEEYTQPQPVQRDALTVKQLERHYQDMLKLVERWSKELGSELADTFSLSAHGSVCLRQPLDEDGRMETRVVRGYLYQHLRSGGYSWLLDEERGMEKYKQLGHHIFEKRQELVKNIDRAIKELSGIAATHKTIGMEHSDLLRYRGDIEKLAEVVRHDKLTQAGPTFWFSYTIQAKVVDGLFRGLTYAVGLSKGNLYPVYYGPLPIAVGAAEAGGATYIEWHGQLLAKFIKDTLAEEVKRLKADRKAVVETIREELTKFTVDGYVPGKCDSRVCYGGREP